MLHLPGRVLEHLGSRHVSRVVYGSIIGLALIVALQAHPPGAGVVLASILGTAVAVGLAELYSEALGTEVRTGRHVDRHTVREILNDAAAVAFGIAAPAVFFLLATLDLMDLDTAFRVSKWSGFGLIAFYGFCAARLAGNALARSLLQAASVVAIAGVLVAMKALVH